jgi:hypothetical protein
VAPDLLKNRFHLSVSFSKPRSDGQLRPTQRVSTSTTPKRHEGHRRHRAPTLWRCRHAILIVEKCQTVLRAGRPLSKPSTSHETTWVQSNSKLARDAQRPSLRRFRAPQSRKWSMETRTRAKQRVPQSPSQRPRAMITEDLSHLRAKARTKKLSRLCSSWARDEDQERITVHAHVAGSDIQTVNAASRRQTCPDPTCGYVHRDNRHGDVLHCVNPSWDCNWQGDVDHVASMTSHQGPKIARSTGSLPMRK